MDTKFDGEVLGPLETWAAFPDGERTKCPRGLVARLCVEYRTAQAERDRLDRENQLYAKTMTREQWDRAMIYRELRERAKRAEAKLAALTTPDEAP